MSFDQLMIHYTAPSFCGIKPANLFSISCAQFCKKNYREWENAFELQGLNCAFQKLLNGRVVVLVYNKSWVTNIISNQFVRDYLKLKGYFLQETDSFISQLMERLYCSQCFPHEIGVVLGYPLKDVISFERFSGKQCKYCGIWKCYSNVENARCYENKLRRCSSLCSKWFDLGYSLDQIIENYKKNSQVA
ncbi:MAG: DUF3793 family protein [Treponema sp.]|nr:DUF3793 family protein [Treponema sp.]